MTKYVESSLYLALFGLVVCATDVVQNPPRLDALDPSEWPGEAKLVRKTTVTPGVTDGHAFTYHDYAGLTGFLAELQTQCPDIVRYSSIGQSVQGRELWVVRITDNPDEQEDEPEFYYHGNMHGDETVGREILIHMLQEICDGYGTDDYFTTLVDETDIHVLISQNPDGFELQQRTNANGVDLNRNFPDQFTTIANPEVETQHVIDFLETRRFSLGANHHGGAVCCNYPFDGKAGYQHSPTSNIPSITPDDALYQHICSTYAENHGTMTNFFNNGITNGADWYMLFGGLQDFSYVYHGMLHVTLELSWTKFPAESQLAQEWSLNQNSLYRFMEQVHRGVRGVVTCGCSGEPVSASLTFEPMFDVTPFEPPPALQSMITRTDPAVGDYHRVLMPGTYTVHVDVDSDSACDAPSPQSVTVEEPTSDMGVDLINSGSTRLDFQLPCPEPTPQCEGTGPRIRASLLYQTQMDLTQIPDDALCVDDG